MKYRVFFPHSTTERRFGRVLSSIRDKKVRARIMDAVESLAGNPRPFGDKPFKKLKPPLRFFRYTAQYRIRIGDYRVLYDVDDKKKIVWILALRRRSERTYR